MRRDTPALRKLASALLAEPYANHWGYDLSKRSGIRSGVIYPILSRMVSDGWLVDGWEAIEETGHHRRRPPRRYYALTDLGRAELSKLEEK